MFQFIIHEQEKNYSKPSSGTKTEKYVSYVQFCQPQKILDVIKRKTIVVGWCEFTPAILSKFTDARAQRALEHAHNEIKDLYSVYEATRASRILLKRRHSRPWAIIDRMR
jgi:hypothetical protein